MHVTIARVCAVCLVALVVSPFTAPFSTCDLGAQGNSGGAQVDFVKATTSVDESLALPASAGPTNPFLSLVAVPSVRVAEQPSLDRFLPLVLRL